MKIIICLNKDIHALTALNFLFAHLQNHQVKIILSQKVGNVDNLPEELEEFTRISSLVNDGNKFLTFEKIAKNFQTEIVGYENINSEIALKDFREFAPDLIISIRFYSLL